MDRIERGISSRYFNFVATLKGNESGIAVSVRALCFPPVAAAAAAAAEPVAASIPVQCRRIVDVRHCYREGHDNGLRVVFIELSVVIIGNANAKNNIPNGLSIRVTTDLNAVRSSALTNHNAGSRSDS
jgi:hypothetical protein